MLFRSRYLVTYEWARRADDVLWRRSKLGLRMKPADTAAVEEAITRILSEAKVAA